MTSPAAMSASGFFSLQLLLRTLRWPLASLVALCAVQAATPINLNHTIGTGVTLTVANADSQTLNANGGSNGLVNNGTLSLASAGNQTNLILAGGDIMFSGTGSVLLSNNSQNRIYGSAGTESLTNALGHTIQGSGQVGVGLLAIANQGLIVANQTAALTIDPNSAGVTNTGTLRATNGATLNLANGTFNNAGGLIEAHDNSHVDFSAATISGGTLTSAGAGHFHANNGSTIANLAISNGSNLEVANAESLNFNGTIQNAGTIKLLSAGNLTSFLAGSSGATLTGGGTISLTNNGNNRIYGASPTTTLVNQDNTIAGAGQIGANQLQLDNRGTIDANLSGGTLTVDPSGTGVVNTGTMRASNGGVLRLQGGAFDNTSGTVRAQAGSKVQLDSATVSNGTVDVAAGGTLELDTSTISGGNLANAGTGTIKTTSGVSTVGAIMTNAPGGQVQVANNTSLQLQSTGVFNNDGTMALNSAGNLTNLIVAGGSVTLNGTGSLALSNNSSNRIYGAATTDQLINGTSHTIQGSGQIGIGLMGFTNQGTVVANQSTALVIDPSASGATNTGTLRATNNATLEITNGTYTNHGGLIEAQAGSTVRFESAVVVGGTLKSSGTGGHLLNAADTTYTDVSLVSGSIFDQNNATTSRFGGTFTNSGDVKLNSAGNSTDLIANTGGLTLGGGGTVTMSNNGNNRIYGINGTTMLTNLDNTIRGAGQVGVNQLQLDNRGTIEASISGATLTIDPSGSGAVNSGTLQALNGGILLLQGGTFDNTGGFVRAQAGSTVRLDSSTVSGGALEVGAGASLTLDASTINGGTLTGAPTGSISTTSGSSTIGGVVTINSGTQLNIANNTSLRLLASGTFTHNGAVNLNSVGNLSDLIVSGGDVTLGGTGSINLGANANNRVYGASAATDRLVLGSGVTLRGGGQVGVGLMGLTNNGVVEANLPSTSLTLDPSALGVTNAGTFRATSGATLRVINGTFTNASGTIEAQDASHVQFEGATISGGTLATAGSGRLVNAASSTYSGVALATGSAFDVNNNTGATFSGTFTNQGTVALNSVGNLSDFIAASSGLTLQGGGTIVLGNNFNNRVYGVTGTTTLVNQNNTIRGMGQIGVNQLQLDNRGTIEASVAGNTLEIDTSGSGLANTGTLQAVGGAVLRLEGSAVNNAGGTVRADGANSAVHLSSSSITGGTLTTANNGVIRTVAGASTLGGALNITTGAQLGINNNTSLTLLASGIYTNDGSITLSSVGNSTDLKVSGGDVTVSGGGSINLGDNTNNRIYGGGGADRLVNASTIRGSGQIGVGLMGVVNQGTIKADQTNALSIDPSAAGVTNTGRLQAQGGATLRLQNGTFTNTGGFIEALGTGSAVEFNGASIVNGTLTSDAGALLKHVGGSTFTDVTLAPGSTLQVLNNTLAHLAGTFTNAAALHLNSVGNFTDLVLNGDVLLDGSGTVTLGNNANNRIYASTATNVLTNRNNIIQGSGQLGVNLMGLNNQATIRANQANALVIDPSAAGMTNTGFLRAETGATLELQSGTFTNTGGTIEAVGANARVDFSNAAVINGTIGSSAGGVLRNAAASTFTDIFLAGTLQIPNNTAATFTGTLTNGGTVQLQSAGNFTDFIVGNGNLNVVGGTIELGNNGNNRIYGATSTNTLVNQSGLIRGVGQFGFNLLRIDNRAVIDANVAGGTLVIDPSGSGAANSGLMTSSNGGILQLSSGTFDNAGGTIFAGTGSRVELNNAVVQGGVLAGGTIRNVAASSLNGLTVVSGATVEIPNATALTLNGVIGNNGMVQIQSAGNFTDLIVATGGATLNGHGVVELGNNANNRLYGAAGTAVLNNVNNTIRGSGQLGIGQLTLTNSGTIEANQSNPLTVNLTTGAAFTNQGTLRATNGASLIFTDALTNAAVVVVQNGSAFTAQTAFTQTGGSTSLQGGTFSAASAAFQGGSLHGSGVINGAVTNSGVLAPGANGVGAGIGALTFNQSLTLTPTSLLRLELGGASSFDTIGAQSIGLNGSLAVAFANGFQFAVQPNETFTLLSTVNTSGLTGTFSGLVNGSRLVTEDGLGSFQINYSSNALTLSQFQALAVPEPSTYALIGCGVVVLFVAHRRRRSQK